MSDLHILRLNLENSNVFSHLPHKSTTGNGVNILSRKNFDCKTIILPIVQKIILDKEFECCLAKVNFDYISACIYILPQHKFIDFFTQIRNFGGELDKQVY